MWSVSSVGHEGSMRGRQRRSYPRIMTLTVVASAAMILLAGCGRKTQIIDTYSPDSSVVARVSFRTPATPTVAQVFVVSVGPRDDPRRAVIMRVRRTALPVPTWLGRHDLELAFGDGAEIDLLRTRAFIVDRWGRPVIVRVLLRPRATSH